MTGSTPDLRVQQGVLVRDQVVDVLRRAILKGELEPGRRLTERELTELTGVSRTSVREALHALQSERLVETSRSRGLQVAMPSLIEVEHIYDLREVLEPLAAKLFVEHASNEQIDAIVEASSHIRRSREVLQRFDELLIAGCGNPVLGEVLTGLYVRLHAVRRMSVKSSERMAMSRREYAALGDAIRRGSADEAADAALEHVRASRQSARHALQESEIEAMKHLRDGRPRKPAVSAAIRGIEAKRTAS